MPMAISTRLSPQSHSEAWRYYENIGTALAPVFISDFTGIDVGSASDPALV